MTGPIEVCDKPVRDAVQRLARALGPELIVLFGSRAQGIACSSSDVDLLLIGNWVGDPEQWARRAQQLVARSFPVIDLVLCTPEELSASVGGRGLFLQSIMEAGQVVYKRSQTFPVGKSTNDPLPRKPASRSAP